MEYSGTGLQQEKKIVVTVNCFTNARNKKIKISAGYIAKKIRQQKPPEHLKP